ncbi:MAG TPA: hypothetical protein VJU80_00515, partial [Solirubrobacteraceae bacterium]|nr:hypothetical protein [Solirubrobacteraceae bacterium]
MARVRLRQEEVSRDRRWSLRWLRARCERAAVVSAAGVLLAGLATIGLGASTGAPAPGHFDLTASIHHQSVRHLQRNFPAAPQVTFGVYPGGAAGTVGPSGPVAPENAALRMAALKRLRPPRRPFALHLYASYTGADGTSAAQQVGEEVRDYGKAGFQTELVFAYRPADGGSPADVGGFVEFVRAAVRSLGPVPGFDSLQVTNEANQGGSPNTSDGYYAGAEDALIEGVIAAKGETRRHGLAHLKVGFNWAYATDAGEHAFWRYLGHHGGRRFIDALDWVGLDAYPGTWGPALGGRGLATETTHFIDRALHAVRVRYMPLAGIPHAVPLRVSETGYPTGPGRTEAMQVTVMKAAVEAVYHARSIYNITGLRWFDLRDA